LFVGHAHPQVRDLLVAHGRASNARHGAIIARTARMRRSNAAAP
jgi:hypothetical protein